MVKFNILRIKNFLSFGNTITEIQLDSHQTTLVVGSNGAGKSTMLDALTFVLYGKPYRNINKPQLVNSVNKKHCLVELDFYIGNKYYLVRRGIKPNIFEIFEDGELIDQDSRSIDYQLYLEKNILQMNYTAFTQIVVLGKATYIPFMRLKLSDRRQLIEELLGLTIFSKMNDVLKNRLSDVKSRHREIENEILVLNEKIELRKKYIKKLAKDKSQLSSDIQNDISLNQNEIRKLEIDIKKLSDKKTELYNRVEKYDVVKKRLKELTKFEFQYKNKIQETKKKINFFVKNDSCPTCKQTLDIDFKDNELSKLNSKFEELNNDHEKLESEIDNLNNRIKSYEKILDQIRKIDLSESELRTKIRAYNSQIEKLDIRLANIANDNVDHEESELDKLRNDLDNLQQDKYSNNTKLGYYQSIGTMLKDTGIKSIIVQKYLPIFNRLINQYLTKFDFFVKFELDDTFKETILSRHKDKFSYLSFSEGEKLRIDMAILLTWREISKMKNAMSTNLLILDEIFDSSLDQTGVDAFIDLIPKMESANIFVISHTPSKLYDKFKNVIEIEKDGNFSVIK